MSKFRKVAKCPGCCPDIVAAIFKATYGPDKIGGSFDVWQCQNCNWQMPRRVNKPTEKITPSQQRVLDKLAALGWKLETKFIGRKLWIEGKCETCFWFGESMFGTIGPRGDFKLTRQIPCLKNEPKTSHLDIWFSVTPKKV